MGASGSRLEDDKGLQLCRARKKFIKQALNGRCSLAAAHLAYIDELRTVGTALSRFVESDGPIEPHPYPSTSPTPGPHALTKNSVSHLSSPSQVAEPANDRNTPPIPSTLPSGKYHSHRMRFRSPFSKKGEERPPAAITVSVTSNTPPYATPPSGAPEPSSFETPVREETAPWDYFGLFQTVDDHRTEDEVPKLEGDVDEKLSSSASEDEFDEPSSSATLVRSFQNLNRENQNGVHGDSPTVLLKEVEGSSARSSGSIEPEAGSPNGVEKNSPDLSPLTAASSRFAYSNDVKMMPLERSRVEERVAPKDFVSSIKNIEELFVKASESGKEIPRMLEANKFHFRPVFRGEGGSVTSSLLKSCFSCGDDPVEARQEPPQNSIKYLTWHRTNSFRSASSRNLLTASSTDGADDLANNLFDSSCMVSGSHASTLDRLYAWEKKLYDEVKAGRILRSHFDKKCKLLRQQESRGESTDKTRAVVKDLHSRIGVALHRINSISKKIEEIRDKELQPQLEELIEGLRKMWAQMLDHHALQFHVISISLAPAGPTQISSSSSSRKQYAVLLGGSLASFSSAFSKWAGAQKLYVESIERWLFKCVALPQTTASASKRNKRAKPPPLRNLGPPIYTVCGAWIEAVDKLPAKAVVESVRDLAHEVARFMPPPRPEKNPDREDGVGSPEDWAPVMDHFQTGLARLLGGLNDFAGSSVKMLEDLQAAIEQAKSSYRQYKSQGI